MLSRRPRQSFPTGTCSGAPVSKTAHSAAQTRGAMERDRAHVLFIEMTMHFEQTDLAIQRRTERLMQRRKALATNVDHRAVHLDDRADGPIPGRGAGSNDEAVAHPGSPELRVPFIQI